MYIISLKSELHLTICYRYVAQQTSCTTNPQQIVQVEFCLNQTAYSDIGAPELKICWNIGLAVE